MREVVGQREIFIVGWIVEEGGGDGLFGVGDSLECHATLRRFETEGVP